MCAWEAGGGRGGVRTLSLFFSCESLCLCTCVMVQVCYVSGFSGCDCEFMGQRACVYFLWDTGWLCVYM